MEVNKSFIRFAIGIFRFVSTGHDVVLSNPRRPQSAPMRKTVAWCDSTVAGHEGCLQATRAVIVLNPFSPRPKVVL